MKIESRGGLFSQIVMRKNRGKVGLVGRFVGTEAGVAVDAIHGFLRIGDVIRGEIEQFGIDGFHQVDHGSLQLGFEDFLARLEPLAAVISLQGA